MAPIASTLVGVSTSIVAVGASATASLLASAGQDRRNRPAAPSAGPVGEIVRRVDVQGESRVTANLDTHSGPCCPASASAWARWAPNDPGP